MPSGKLGIGSKGWFLEECKTTKRLKGYFLRGLAVLLPTRLTIWILVVVYTFIRDNVSTPINKGLVWTLLESKKGAGVIAPGGRRDVGVLPRVYSEAHMSDGHWRST